MDEQKLLPAPAEEPESGDSVEKTLSASVNQRRGGTKEYISELGKPYRLTPERSRELVARRKEITAQKLRKAISEKGAKFFNTPGMKAADVMAEAGGVLFEEIVLNKEARPRDRKEVWELVGQHMDVLRSGGDWRGDSQPAPGVSRITADLTDEGLRALVDALAKRR